ncbi:hypothetical protein HMPREF9103_01965 [Lentilactobacillus parafarraginis F0439]|uniref:Uncharacterized protein n=1 Tax=Lentilactobacillus parafarraginis F0439 TaxID=797515 RepID=G9ZQF8_9LACO|nr:hypothetical protein HMPREF9103_01965 [Lentilactobacillus parafarraginis F0439]
MNGAKSKNQTVLTFSKRTGKFSHVKLEGFGKNAHVVYTNKSVKVTD